MTLTSHETTAPVTVTETQEAVVPTDIPVLEMVQPMIGFPEQQHFALARLDDDGDICDLRAVDGSGLSFVVVPPHLFFADYSPEIDDETVALLGLESEQDLLTLVVVTFGESIGDATANLLAPVLINHHTRRAAQVLLHEDLPLRAPIAPAQDVEA